MNAIEFEGVNLHLGAPANWDPEKDGECDVLPVLVKDGREYISRWSFSAEEREAIAKGADIFLHIFSEDFTQPPVMLQLSDDRKMSLSDDRKMSSE